MELVVLAPVLFILAMFLLAFGRISDARQEVVESSSAGAQVASILADAAAAQSGASAAAVEELLAQGHLCPSPQVSTDVSHFYAGGYVRVTVECRVSFAGLLLPGFPGSTIVRASSVAPIDPYRSVQ